MLTFVNTYHSLPSLLACESELDIGSVFKIGYHFHIFTKSSQSRANHCFHSFSLSLPHTNTVSFWVSF